MKTMVAVVEVGAWADEAARERIAEADVGNTVVRRQTSFTADWDHCPPLPGGLCLVKWCKISVAFPKARAGCLDLVRLLYRLRMLKAGSRSTCGSVRARWVRRSRRSRAVGRVGNACRLALSTLSTACRHVPWPLFASAGSVCVAGDR